VPAIYLAGFFLDSSFHTDNIDGRHSLVKEPLRRNHSTDSFLERLGRIG